MAEIWKPVPSLPGVLASSLGRIVLPPSYSPMRRGGYRLYAPEPTFGHDTRAKVGAAHVYKGFTTKKLGRLKVHQLVCEAFHGPRPKDGFVVIHIDEDGRNNRPENLRWGTQKENLNAPGFLAYCGERSKRNVIGRQRTKQGAFA